MRLVDTPLCIHLYKKGFEFERRICCFICFFVQLPTQKLEKSEKRKIKQMKNNKNMAERERERGNNGKRID